MYTSKKRNRQTSKLKKEIKIKHVWEKEKEGKRRRDTEMEKETQTDRETERDTGTERRNTPLTRIATFILGAQYLNPSFVTCFERQRILFKLINQILINISI